MKTLFVLVFFSLFVGCSSKKVTEKPVVDVVSDKEVPVKKPIPAPASGAEVKTILLFGDSGTGGKDQYLTARGMKKVCDKLKCDFAVMLGDNIYDNGLKKIGHKKQYTHLMNPYKDLDFVFWMALGNHDHRFGRDSVLTKLGKEQHAKDKKFRMLDDDYLIPGLPSWLHMYVMDTNEMGEDGASDLKRDLCKKKGWKVVLGHHPPYSSGQHQSNSKMIKYAVPVFKKCNVHLGFFGHDHNLEMIERHGMRYFISGAAAKLRSIKKKTSGSRWVKSILGFSTLTIAKDKWQVKFWDKNGEFLYGYKTALKEGGGEEGFQLHPEK